MDDVKDLIEDGQEEFMESAENVTHSEGGIDEPNESNEPEQFEQTEGDVAYSNEPKEEWLEDEQQNVAQIESDSKEQVEGGAFEQARNSWASGWKGGL